MAINEGKLQDIYAECVKVRGQKYLSKNKFQALMGKLLYIQKIVKPARVFINRILATFREGSHKQKICDNHSVVQVVKNGKTRDPFLALCIRNIWLHTAIYDVHLIIEHVAGKENRIADTLSRIHSNKLVDKNILKHLVKNYHWEPIFHSYFDLTLHI